VLNLIKVCEWHYISSSN